MRPYLCLGRRAEVEFGEHVGVVPGQERGLVILLLAAVRAATWLLLEFASPALLLAQQVHESVRTLERLLVAGAGLDLELLQYRHEERER